MMMEKCSLLISANESYERGEKDLEKFTGISVSHSTLQRLVKSQEFGSSGFEVIIKTN